MSNLSCFFICLLFAITTCNQAVYADGRNVIVSIPGEADGIRGDRFKAILVVYDDFVSDISKHPKSNSQELDCFLSNPNNYAISVLYDDKKKYIVRFYPDLFKGRYLRGGETQYTIEKKHLQLSLKRNLCRNKKRRGPYI